MGHFINKELKGISINENRLVKERKSTYVYLLKVGDLYVEQLKRDKVSLTKHIEHAEKFNYIIDSPNDWNDFHKNIEEFTEVLNNNYTIVEYIVEINIYETPMEFAMKADGKIRLESTEKIRRQREEQEKTPLKVTDGIVYRPREEDGLVVAINSKGEQITAPRT